MRQRLAKNEASLVLCYQIRPIVLLQLSEFIILILSIEYIQLSPLQHPLT